MRRVKYSSASIGIQFLLFSTTFKDPASSVTRRYSGAMFVASTKPLDLWSDVVWTRKHRLKWTVVKSKTSETDICGFPLKNSSLIITTVCRHALFHIFMIVIFDRCCLRKVSVLTFPCVYGDEIEDNGVKWPWVPVGIYYKTCILPGDKL